MTLETLCDSIRTETQIPNDAQHIYHNGHLIADRVKTLEEMGIVDGDMLALHVRKARDSGSAADARGRQSAAAASSSAPVAQLPTGGAATMDNVRNNPELLRLQLLSSPEARAHLQRAQPALADALEDPARFANLLQQNFNRDLDERRARQDQIDRWNADPFDVESQARIEEMIRQERVMENLQNAMEYNPEVFGRVHMLYLNVVINGTVVKAMVDSGAQATVMSPSCAESCGIMRLVDKRFSGIARGVGTANIIGRVHLFQIRIGNMFLPCSFTVMEGKAVDLLLGLDMLKRHQATIDLARDRLIIQGEEVPFLGEAEIPKMLEDDEETAQVSGPAGTTIDSRSGAVSTPAEPQPTPGTPAAAAAAAAHTAAERQHASAFASIAGTQPAPAPTAAASATTTSAPNHQASGFPESDIEQLMALGFPREGALSALQAAGGNVEVAAGLLFGA
ncbi:DNA damage-inducible protein 1 [Ceratocystis lukuohia]|uniref:DNA damage-inducible protein 1 n=1 Tax=Ceratocystis lukuohia TaxID=2019550 RepID=A0ABR4MMV4_9PEZI